MVTQRIIFRHKACGREYNVGISTKKGLLQYFIKSQKYECRDLCPCDNIRGMRTGYGYEVYIPNPERKWYKPWTWLKEKGFWLDLEMVPYLVGYDEYDSGAARN